MPQKKRPSNTARKSTSHPRRPHAERSDVRDEDQNLTKQSRVMEMQQTLGNAAVQRILQKPSADSQPNIIQRKPVAEEMKQPLASISIEGSSVAMDAYPNVTNGTVNAEAELVPSWAKPGEFKGFERRVEAYGHAWAQTELTAVVEDSEGRFHAFKTGWPGRSLNQVHVTIFPLQNGFSRVWWVNMPGRGDPSQGTGEGSWGERARKAWLRAKLWSGNQYHDLTCPHDGLHGDGKLSKDRLKTCLDHDFQDLLAEALDIRKSDIHVAESYGDHSPDALVNFDLDMGSTHGEAGGKVPYFRDDEVKKPTLAVGPSAFMSKSHLFPLSTVIHEATHVSHAVMAQDLFKEWRDSKSKKTFFAWLERKLIKKKITQEQYDLAIDMMESTSADSEILAHLEGFKIVFQRAPKNEDDNRVENLGSISDYWKDAQPNTRLIVLQRLAAFYKQLNEELKKEFAAHVRQEAGVSGGEAKEDDLSGPFWKHVVSKVLSEG